MEDNIHIIGLFILLIGLLLMIFITLNEFYDDYKCSTTQDIEYFTSNKCERFLYK